MASRLRPATDDQYHPRSFHSATPHKKVERFEALKVKFRENKLTIETEIKDWKNSHTKMEVECDQGHKLWLSNCDLVNRLNQSQWPCKHCYQESRDPETTEGRRAAKKLEAAGMEFLRIDPDGRGLIYRCRCEPDVEKHTYAQNILKAEWGAHCVNCQRGVGRFQTKTYTFPSGRQAEIMGWEGSCIDQLLEDYKEEQIDVDSDRIPIIHYLRPNEDGTERKARYFPDIKLPDRIVEVKSVHTYELERENNERKFKAATLTGHDIEVWIFRTEHKLAQKRYYCRSSAAIVCCIDDF